MQTLTTVLKNLQSVQPVGAQMLPREPDALPEEVLREQVSEC